MTFENILYEVKDSVCTITVNRPDKLNALNKRTIAEIGEAVKDAQHDNNVNVIILTGAGSKAFVAGADISEFADYNLDEAKALSKHGHDVFNSIENCTKPVIAAINGFALGGGCELAMSCHLRVASENAKFGQPEVKLGLTPGYAGTQRLPRLIGRTKATELLLTADMISANEALQLGLVNYVVKQEELMSRCMEIANKIKQQAPVAIAEIINCINFYYSNSDGFAEEINAFGRCFTTDDFKEGTKAFLEKRKANFSGK
jgi:enoyl-CoA hydratase